MPIVPWTTAELTAMMEQLPATDQRVTLLHPLEAIAQEFQFDGPRKVTIKSGTTVRIGSTEPPDAVLPGAVLFSIGDREYTAEVQPFLDAIGTDWKERQEAIDAVSNPNQHRFDFRAVGA